MKFRSLETGARTTGERDGRRQTNEGRVRVGEKGRQNKATFHILGLVQRKKTSFFFFCSMCECVAWKPTTSNVFLSRHSTNVEVARVRC